MKKLIRIALIGMLVVLAFCLFSCFEKAPAIESIEMSDLSPSEVLINQFKIEDYTVLVNYDNGVVKEVQMTEDMIDSTDYLNIVKRVGEHTLTVNYKGFSFDYKITVKQYEFTNVYLEGESIDYDGQYHSLTVTGNIPENTTIEFQDNNSYKNVNTYTVVAFLKNEKYVTKRLEANLTIKKVDYPKKITFPEVSETYDGTEKSVHVEGIDGDVVVRYYIGEEETNSKINVGTYKVTAKFDSMANYNDIKDISTTLTITKAQYNMKPYAFYDKTVYYTGQRHEMHITNESALPQGVSVKYSGLDAVNAGVYEIKAIFTGNPNYEDIPSLSATLTIKQAQVAISGIYLDSLSITYDGKEHIIEYQGSKPNSIVFVGYTAKDENGTLVYDSNSDDDSLKHQPTNAGLYTVYAHFQYRDSKNYEAIEPLSAILQINKADIEGIVIENETKEYMEDLGQSLSVYCPIDGIIPHPDTTNPVEPGDYSITYSFELVGDTAINYNVPEPITRVLSITKRSISAKLTNNRYEVEFNNATQNIVVELSESEKEWIIPHFFTLDSQGNKHTFTGATLPDTYLVFVEYEIDESKAPKNYASHYYIPSRDSAYLIIKKKNLVITDSMLSNQKLYFDSNLTQSVTLTNMQALLDANPGLSAECVKITYSNNSATAIGYYTASLKVDLSGSATALYVSNTSYTFHFAIRSANQGYNVYPTVLQKTFDYDGAEHSIQLSTLPDGITMYYDDTNSMTLPGSKTLRIAFVYANDGGIAEWFYSLPTVVDTNLQGEPVMTVTLTVNKIEYVPEVTIPTFVYDYQAGNRVVTLKNAYEGMNVEVFYDDEERVNVGTYYFTVKTTIYSTELLSIYTKESQQRYSFDITKAQYIPSFSGLNAKYDGTAHEIVVSGLDEYKELGWIDWTISGDKQVEIGKYNVIVHFNNYSSNFYNLADQSVTLVIENTKIDCTSLISAATSSQFKVVQQFTSIKSFFNTFADPKAFSFTYRVDYYYNSELQKDATDTQFHFTGTTEDYAFNDYTTGSEFVLIEFIATLNKGFTDKNNVITGPYHGYVRVKVNPLVELDVSEMIQTLKTKGINQGETLETLYFPSLNEFIVVDYDVAYYDGDTPYASSYTEATGTMSDGPYSFPYNTWGDKYARLHITMTAPSGTYLFDGVHSYKVLDQYINVKVKATSVVDVTDFVNAFASTQNAYQFDRLKTYFENPLYDESLITYSLTILDGIETLATNVQDYIVAKGNHSYGVAITLTAKSGLTISQNNQSSATINTTFYVNAVDHIDYLQDLKPYIDSFYAGVETTYQQYTYISDVIKLSDLPNKVKFDMTVVFEDNTVYSTSSTDPNYGIYQLDKYIDGRENFAMIKLVLKSTDPSCLLEDENHVLQSSMTIIRSQPIRKATVYSMSTFTSQLSNLTSKNILMYTKLIDYIPSLEQLVQDGITASAQIQFTGIHDTKGSFNTLVPIASNKILNYSFVDYVDDPDHCRNVLTTISFYFSTPTSSEYIFSTNDTDPHEYAVLVPSVVIQPVVENASARTKYNYYLNNKLCTLMQYNEVNEEFAGFFSDYGMNFLSYKVDEVYRSNNQNTTNYQTYAHVSKNAGDKYNFSVVPSSDKYFKLSLTYSFPTGYTLFDENGLYRDKLELILYVNVNPDNYAIDVSTLKNITLPTYVQYTGIYDTYSKIPVPENISLYHLSFEWTKDGANYISGGFNFAEVDENSIYYHVTMQKDPTAYHHKLIITYQIENGYHFVENGAVVDVSTYMVTYNNTAPVQKVTLLDMTAFQAWAVDSTQYINSGTSVYQTLVTHGCPLSGAMTVNVFKAYKSGSEGINYNYTETNGVIPCQKGYYYQILISITAPEKYCFEEPTELFGQPERTYIISFTKLCQ